MIRIFACQGKVLYKLQADILNNCRVQPNLCKMSLSTKSPEPHTISENTKESFLDGLPSLLDTVSNYREFLEVPEAGDWLKKILKYNLEGGKKSRGITTLLAYKMLEKPENINEESLQSAKILGWCVEMFNDAPRRPVLVPAARRRAGGHQRRDPDMYYIYSSMFYVIRSQFGNEKFYTKILELFNEALAQTFIGQHLDFKVANHLKNYTMDHYNAIVRHKASFYTFKLPICLGLLLANNTDPAKHKMVKDICIEMGKFFQVQDDYIDCYGDETVSGKKGTDIQEGKCSWFAVSALQRCSAAQRRVFGACYGSREPAHEQRVRALYEQLGLRALYERAETDMYRALLRQARALPDDLSPGLFVKLIDMIYKRSR